MADDEIRRELEDYKLAAGAEAHLADEYKAERDELIARLNTIVALLDQTLNATATETEALLAALEPLKALLAELDNG